MTSDGTPATSTRPADFDSVAQTLERFAEAGYFADERLATTVFLQTRLDKPVLLEGPAGVGKTQLATSLAAVTGRRLLRLQCYEGQDETKALYEWDYGKQMLYTQILREKIGQVVEDAADLHEAVERIAAQDSVFFSERFLAPRPLLEAIDVRRAGRAADRRGRPGRRGARGRAPGAALGVPDLHPRDRHRQGQAPAVRRAHLEQHPRPVGGAQAALPAPVPGLPRRRARAGDHPLQGHRPGRVAGRAAGRHRPRPARAGAAQVAEHLRDRRLGPHPGGARRRGAHRRRAVEHPERGGEVRARPGEGAPRHPRAGRPQPRGARQPRRPRPRSRSRRTTATTATTTRPPRLPRPVAPTADDGDVDGRAKRAAKDLPGRHDGAYQGVGGSSDDARGVTGKKVSASQGQRSFAARSARKRPV